MRQPAWPSSWPNARSWHPCTYFTPAPRLAAAHAQASVKLMGKLMFKVAGTSGNIVVDGGSDDEVGAGWETNE